MQIKNGGKTYTLASATFPYGASAKGILSTVNADDWCGFAPGTAYMSRVVWEADDTGTLTITRCAIQSPVSGTFPAVTWSDVLIPTLLDAQPALSSPPTAPVDPITPVGPTDGSGGP